eukprot:365968-Chlamydomonas_euryale.AAC.4
MHRCWKVAEEWEGHSAGRQHMCRAACFMHHGPCACLVRGTMRHPCTHASRAISLAPIRHAPCAARHAPCTMRRTLMRRMPSCMPRAPCAMHRAPHTDAPHAVLYATQAIRNAPCAAH